MEGEVYNEVEPFPGTPEIQPAVKFQRIDRRTAQEMFTTLPKEAKWGEVVVALVRGEAVFVPNMTRNQLESVRTIVNRRAYGRLRSKTTNLEGTPGRLLRIQRKDGK